MTALITVRWRAMTAKGSNISVLLWHETIFCGRPEKRNGKAGKFYIRYCNNIPLKSFRHLCVSLLLFHSKFDSKNINKFYENDKKMSLVAINMTKREMWLKQKKKNCWLVIKTMEMSSQVIILSILFNEKSRAPKRKQWNERITRFSQQL